MISLSSLFSSPSTDPQPLFIWPRFANRTACMFLALLFQKLKEEENSSASPESGSSVSHKHVNQAQAEALPGMLLDNLYDPRLTNKFTNRSNLQPRYAVRKWLHPFQLGGGDRGHSFIVDSLFFSLVFWWHTKTLCWWYWIHISHPALLKAYWGREGHWFCQFRIYIKYVLHLSHSFIHVSLTISSIRCGWEWGMYNLLMEGD